MLHQPFHYDLDDPETDIIHIRNGAWWFWDVYFLNEIGPYETRDEAAEAQLKYFREHYL